MTGPSPARPLHDPVAAEAGPDVARQRARLEDERRALKSTLESACADPDPVDTSAIAANLRASLDAVTDALARIDDGTYGRCCDCGRWIAFERLLAIPEASRCVSCQQAWAG
jgi:RNA polymerase-binding transcription factor DksA